MYQDTRWEFLLCTRGSLAPIIANGVREDGSIGVEVGGRDGGRHSLEGVKFLLDVLVPENDLTVGSRCGKLTHGVERYAVDRKDIVLMTVTLEGKVLL